MVCIHCGNNTSITNSRLQHRNNNVWRRRNCDVCGSIFTTIESPAYEAAWAVQNLKSSISPFSRDKLLLSLYKSCEHRPTAINDAASLTDTIINRLSKLITDGRIKPVDIAQVSFITLNRFDKVASVSYQAHHNLAI